MPGSVSLRLRFFALPCAGEIVKQDVRRGTVKNDMVAVHEQPDGHLCPDDLHAEEPVFKDVEGRRQRALPGSESRLR